MLYAQHARKERNIYLRLKYKIYDQRLNLRDIQFASSSKLDAIAGEII